MGYFQFEHDYPKRPLPKKLTKKQEVEFRKTIASIVRSWRKKERC
jgi:hypothetical protein